MREPESYWTRKGPAIPDVADLPSGTFNGDDRAFSSLSPSMRRVIWREALHREAKARKLPEDMIARVRIATISGGLSSLDDYLFAFERADAAWRIVSEDAERLRRADDLHQQGEVRITARESL